MNYRHIYHAGSFTDVFKHIVLIALIKSFLRKESPFCYLDTHAGNGYYDLFSESANKTKEYTNGIEKIIQQKNPPPLIKEYLSYVSQLNLQFSQSTDTHLHYYPGSPFIARQLLRLHDRIVACELHPAAYQDLKAACVGDRQMHIHHIDGYLGLKSLLPPKERRGLVLIDPPYEHPDEFMHITQALKAAIKKWPAGTYCIWYPIKEKELVNRFHRMLKQEMDQPLQIVELNIYNDIAQHLNGSGMAILNPPWQFAESIEKILPWLWKALSINGQGNYTSVLEN